MFSNDDLNDCIKRKVLLYTCSHWHLTCFYEVWLLETIKICQRLLFALLHYFYPEDDIRKVINICKKENVLSLHAAHMILTIHSSHFSLKNWAAIRREQHVFFLMVTDLHVWKWTCKYVSVQTCKHVCGSEKKGTEKEREKERGGMEWEGDVKSFDCWLSCWVAWGSTTFPLSYFMIRPLCYWNIISLVPAHSASKWQPCTASTHQTHREHAHFGFFWFQSSLFGRTRKIIFHTALYWTSKRMCDSMEPVLFIIPSSFKFQTDWCFKVNAKVNLYMMCKI